MSSQPMPSVSVIVPVYNSQGTLRELVERLTAALTPLCPQYEIILINDGSRDQSWQVIEDLALAYPAVRGISMMRNYGQHNALLCGLRNASYEVSVTLDDDLQHPPEEIHSLLETLAQGFDVVYGVPRKLPHSAWRNFFSWFTKRAIAYAIGIPSLRQIGAFRAFRTHLRDAFAGYQSPHVIIDALLSWGTTRFGAVPVDERQREVGKSNYNFARLFSQGMLVLTGFSTKPLRFTSFLGFGFTLFGVGIFLYVLIAYLAAGSIPGFPFLASIIAIFSGTQLFALGILGEYIGRVFDRSTDRPTYVIGDTTDKTA